MKGRVKVKVAEQPRAETCRHYWVIDVANGPASRGECKYCGTKKDFLNAFPEFNPLKRKSHSPLTMPRMPEVEPEEEEKDSESLVSG